MTTAVQFEQIEAPTPTYEGIAAEYADIRKSLDEASDADARARAIETWDTLRRRLDTWGSLVHLRFNQDTTNEKYKADREYCDQLTPRVTELDVDLKKTLLASQHRSELTDRFGDQAFQLWEVDVLTYDPAIQDDLVTESTLEAEYNELLAAARLEYRGETHNMSAIGKFSQEGDREVRHGAEQVRWAWFAENGPELDRIYDDLVKLRHKMAIKLGFDDFIGLGYKRMTRIDYDQADVERYRDEVRQHVVPLAQKIRAAQAETLGLEKLMAWDEAVFDPGGNPKPQGDHDWMVEQAREMFDAMGGGIDTFYRMMVDSHLLDLKNRDGKAGGGFCTAFPSEGVPFVFANFNGTKGDVEVFTHEMGHAFQVYEARRQPLVDYFWPTYESCEIHSMSLEFLTWPHMEKFFGDEADRFRRIHLAQSLMFLPYGVAVDHFQHEVYARPDATPAERNQMWLDLEKTYMPWRDWGDLAYPAGGGRWQLQRHIYLNAFYYIDYTLAQVCALQFWVAGEKDPAEAMERYVRLCRRGGEAPFQELARSAGLRSPFEPGCLEEVVELASRTLEI